MRFVKRNFFKIYESAKIVFDAAVALFAIWYI